MNKEVFMIIKIKELEEIQDNGLLNIQIKIISKIIKQIHRFKNKDGTIYNSRKAKKTLIKEFKK